MPSPAEIAAYIGAGAWIPILLALAYRLWVRPSVTVTPENSVSIGYTTYGPIFNLNFGISVDKKDAVIEHFGVRLTHQSGAIHDLIWRSMSETFSQIRDAAGTQQVVEKEHLAIALRLSTSMLTERLVRFQDPEYHDVVRESSAPLTEHVAFLRENDRISEGTDSQEFHNFAQAVRNHYWWLLGRYEVEFYFRSPHQAELKKRTWQFTLTQVDIDRLRSNLDLIESDLENVLMIGQEGYEEHKPEWQWVNPALTLVAD